MVNTLTPLRWLYVCGVCLVTVGFPLGLVQYENTSRLNGVAKLPIGVIVRINDVPCNGLVARPGLSLPCIHSSGPS